ncbi:transcriptional regulator with XRE-family HTH domain [Catenuloplanes nepalensis]|uniref:Transcriptional regulator with XRE-family HTH domain n=1 Tax=Catenuloplanes nepalensis TaxID=587533 RepID=A0ABT9MV47_9ACTN|nr:helix-turn-helix domain-containing protein [Catenuloplanes nepalensis]MDP9795314.1 transcriptional regulator with XRE-family HTH domain [Catenuloplanes nepalensis]
MTDLGWREAADEREFRVTLKTLQEKRGLSNKDLAAAMQFHPSYVSHIVSGRCAPTPNFAMRADAVLGADGELLKLCVKARHGDPGDPGRRAVIAREAETPAPGSSELIVEREEASVRYDEAYRRYQISIRRHLLNRTAAPVTWFPAHVAPDASPDDYQAAKRLYTAQPISDRDLGFHARYNGRPVTWEVERVSEWRRDIAIRFRRFGLHEPIYPGERATVEYGYRLPETHWGDWFEREIRWLTKQLVVRLEFPRHLAMHVAGEFSSMSGDRPLDPPATVTPLGDLDRFEWRSDTPLKPGVSVRFAWTVTAATPARRHEFLVAA